MDVFYHEVMIDSSLTFEEVSNCKRFLFEEAKKRLGYIHEETQKDKNYIITIDYDYNAYLSLSFYYEI